MDFSRAGAVQALSGAFRARVQWKQDGHLCEGPGPRRPTRKAAEEDLESMRAAASGMSREDGFAVTGGPPLQAPIAMYPFGGFAETPLSSCPYDEFPLSPLPCGPKPLADTPSLSAEGAEGNS